MLLEKWTFAYQKEKEKMSQDTELKYFIKIKSYYRLKSVI